MNTAHFLNLNSGKWMTQRTTYITNSSKIYFHKSDTTIQEERQLAFLKNIMENKNHNSEIISSYIIQNKIDKDIKYFLQYANQNYCQILKGQTLNIISDHMNKYNHISIKYISGHLNSMERIWLVNSNLRLGINVIKKQNKCIAVTFSSDIKII